MCDRGRHDLPRGHDDDSKNSLRIVCVQIKAYSSSGSLIGSSSDEPSMPREFLFEALRIREIAFFRRSVPSGSEMCSSRTCVISGELDCLGFLEGARGFRRGRFGLEINDDLSHVLVPVERPGGTDKGRWFGSKY